MTRRYGRAPRGERVCDSAPRNYGTHTSVIGAMGLGGLVATLAVEGAVDTLCFDAYAERVLGPRLRPGDVVVLDNLDAHRAGRFGPAAGQAHREPAPPLRRASGRTARPRWPQRCG